jgi:hypothetical protein
MLNSFRLIAERSFSGDKSATFRNSDPGPISSSYMQDLRPTATAEIDYTQQLQGYAAKQSTSNKSVNKFRISGEHTHRTMYYE